MKQRILGVCSLLWVLLAQGQVPRSVSSAEIMQQMKKLKVLGCVLYVAAHPDDENTRLIAYLANEKLYRTGYLSLTRGDGGQNLIGDEQGTELGLIRTQELLAARRIDGGEQFFSRAYDFGYSKSTDEALRIWDKDKVLGDVVWVIRKFQPDVIIARFPEDARAGHGHHSASGLMARLGYEAASDADKYADQIPAGVQVWQAKRMLWNTFNFGGTNTTDSTQFQVEVGDYMPLLGKSMGELAGESRSQHKSQGFGVSRQRGSGKEFFTTLKGDKPKNDLMDGVNTTWERIAGAEGIQQDIDAIIKNFEADNTAASVPGLKRLLQKLYRINSPSAWVNVKREEVKKLILACAGIYAEATVSNPAIIAGDSVNVRLSMINRSAFQSQITGVEVSTLKKELNQQLGNNVLVQTELKPLFSNGLMETQPYWLREMQTTGMFNVSNQQLIGMPENKPLSVQVRLTVDTLPLTLEVPIKYRYVDPVKAEQYQPVYMSNAYLVYNDPGILLFRKNQKDSATIDVNITAQKNAVATGGQINLVSDSSAFRLQLPPQNLQWNANDKRTIKIKVPNYLRGTAQEQDQLEVYFKPDGTTDGPTYLNARRTIEYDHIPTQVYHYQDKIKVLHIDLKGGGKKVGYIPGAGDKVIPALMQMGYTVTELKESDLVPAVLKNFDAIITGVRAYNVHEYLSNAYPALMQYVNEGGNLIVQYNTNSNVGPVKAKIAPFNMNIGRTRITDETAAVQFLLPNHPALNFPNKISAKDFEGWIQERSIYHADGFDATQFATPIAFADPGEPVQNGSLAIAAYGKGNFVYTGLVFFRELPAGVPGAYRLMANLIEMPGH